jgi:uncharacterized SAM-dependent methyltransferase
MTISDLRPKPEIDASVQEFYDGIVDLFFGFRAGHLGRYCFSSAKTPQDTVRGDEHWTHFIKTSTAYYPYQHEVAIIQRSATQIGQVVADAKAFIDLGTGSLNSFEHKVLPILRAGVFETLTFVDLCTTFSRLADARLKQENLKIATDTFIGNFFTDLPVPPHKAVVNLFGITLGNIIVDLPNETPEQGLLRTMKHFAAPLSEQGGYFIFDYDTNEDAPSIHATYDHPSYRAMERTIFDRVKRDLPTENFNPDDFEHVTVWYPHWKLLAQELKAKKDVSFKLGPYQFNFPCGTSFRTGSSFKYADSTIESAANQAGFKLLKLFQMPGSPMRLAIYGIDRK